MAILWGRPTAGGDRPQLFPAHELAVRRRHDRIIWAIMGDRDLLDSQARQELAVLYGSVPATCCASSGECCQLTEEEYQDRYATMFPLFRVEYLHVLDFVRSSFDAPRRHYLLTFVQERPRRCPFLGGDNRCTIYPARPLICRTYAVLHTDTIAAAVARNRGRVPANWLRRFAQRENSMVCPRARVTEPEKLEAYADRLAGFDYERALLRLSRATRLTDTAQDRVFTEVTGHAQVPLRWSWGGFNMLCTSPPAELRTAFADYWESAELPDAG